MREKGQKWMNTIMSKEIVDAIFSQAKKYLDDGKTISNLILFGGEPLLKSNLSIVSYIIKKYEALKIPISTITNVYSIDCYSEFLNKNNLGYLQITLDGKKESHNSRRYLTGGQPTYDKICKNIKLALDKGVEVTVRSNVNKKNFDKIKGLIDMYLSKGWMNYKNFHYYFKSTHECYEVEENVLTDVQLMKKLSEYYDGVEKYTYNTIYTYISTNISNMITKKGYAPFKSGYCGANNGMYTVDSYGDIYSCWDVLGDKKQVIRTLEIDSGRFKFNDVVKNIYKEYSERQSVSL